MTPWAEIPLLDRMVLAVERVRDRLIRSTSALEAAGVPYAVAGGNAVAAWVATVEPAAVRNTQDVDILIRRSDFDAAAVALAPAGFIRRHVSGIDLFLDGPDAKARDAIHIVPANEKIRPDYATAAPDVTDSEKREHFQLLSLEPLVRMKLTSLCLNDLVDLRDMLDVGLIDAKWVKRFPPEMGTRLQQLIDTPEG